MTVLSDSSAKPSEHRISPELTAEPEHKECEESRNKNPGTEKLAGSPEVTKVLRREEVLAAG